MTLTFVYKNGMKKLSRFGILKKTSRIRKNKLTDPNGNSENTKKLQIWPVNLVFSTIVAKEIIAKSIN
jgi:hypothetical protein